MQAYWNRFAFVRLVIMMMLGIISAYIGGQAFWLLFIIFLLSLLCYFLLLSFRPSLLVNWKAISLGFFAFLICFSVGYLNTYQQAEKYNSTHLLNYDFEQVEAFRVILDSKVTATTKSYGFTAKINAAKFKGKWHEVEGKTKLYFEQSEKSAAFQYGDEILISSPINRLEVPKNPHEFDYQSYLALSQIYFQQYVKADKAMLLKGNQGHTVMDASYQASSFLSKQLASYISDEQSFAIANALTLGMKDHLDNELKDAYAAAGAMHVLAVSGLHVGIIFMIVAFIFKRWRSQKWGRWLYAATSLLVLWSFAFITGLSPSVMRAATMFSFVVIAQASRRHTNIYNTLAASAFLLLLVDPFLLFSVGFQLSYLAVFGIVYFQPRIQLLLPVKNKWIDKLCILTSVSIAAQMVTAPLGMLYFHQFPTYFFLSNILVIPAAFVILNASLLLMLCSFWPAVASAFGIALSYFIKWVNEAIFWLEELPFSTVEGINPTSFETIVMYAVIIILALFIAQKSFHYWMMLCMAVLLLSASIIYRQYETTKTEKLTLHALPSGSLLSYLKGGEAVIYQSSLQTVDSSSINYHVLPYIHAHGSKITSIDSTFKKFSLPHQDWNGLSFLEWKGKTIVQLNKPFNTRISATKELINVDYLILSNNVWRESSVIFELFSPQLVIIDGSNSYYHIKKLAAWLDKQEIIYYIVPEKGAFEFKI